MSYFEKPIRHEIPPARWPNREEAQNSLLFRPLSVGPLQLSSRTWVPAMVPWRATDDGFVTKDNLEWYERFAMGRPGALVVEATGVRDIASGPLLRIGHDRYIDGLRELVERVRIASGGETRLFIQIIDFLTVRRRPEPDRFFDRFLSITDRHREAIAAQTNDDRWKESSEQEVRDFLKSLPEEMWTNLLDKRELESLRYGYRERVTDMELDHIRRLPEMLPGIFADAAERARRAGFDGVELHYAHAYTMSSFLSALNNRPDGYGGSQENRVRLPLEVYEEVRRKVGDDYVVGVRFLSDEVIEGGSRINDAVYFARRFAAAGFNYLSISKGGKFEDARQPKIGQAVYPYTGRSGYECMPTVLSDELGPFGRNTGLAREIHNAVRQDGFDTPTVTAGGITTFDQAEAILQRGDADIVALARQALADPDWFVKVRNGEGDKVRRCTYTNYCEALDQAHKQVTCKLWDRVNLDEPGIPMSFDGRRRLLPPV
jgi:2,4-dienoyl-CoA reductase-like NADH-dependent reductase (Old Yellow Enzyme family)